MSSSFRGASVVQVPRRLRFSRGALGDRHRVEVPFRPECSGWWQLQPIPAEAAQTVRIALACREDALLLFDGLYDGERVAGSLHIWHDRVATFNGDVPWADAVRGEGVGDFLGTRLFSFWGPPSPTAAGKLPVRRCCP